MRVPVSMFEQLGGVEELIRKAKRKLPLYVVGKPNEKLGA